MTTQAPRLQLIIASRVRQTSVRPHRLPVVLNQKCCVEKDSTCNAVSARAQDVDISTSFFDCWGLVIQSNSLVPTSLPATIREHVSQDVAPSASCH